METTISRLKLSGAHFPILHSRWWTIFSSANAFLQTNSSKTLGNLSLFPSYILYIFYLFWLHKRWPKISLKRERTSPIPFEFYKYDGSSMCIASSGEPPKSTLYLAFFLALAFGEHLENLTEPFKGNCRNGINYIYSKTTRRQTIFYWELLTWRKRQILYSPIQICWKLQSIFLNRLYWTIMEVLPRMLYFLRVSGEELSDGTF